MSHPLDQQVDKHGPAPRGEPGRAVVRGRGPRAGGVRLREVRPPVAVGLAALAGVAYLGLTDPYRPGAHLACPVLALTGWYCAGCGGQRAVHELAQLDLVAAWAMNPLVVLAAPLAAVAWLRWLLRRARAAWGARDAPPGRVASSTAVPWVVVAVVVAFAGLRNVPALAPWLAP